MDSNNLPCQIRSGPILSYKELATQCFICAHSCSRFLFPHIMEPLTSGPPPFHSIKLVVCYRCDGLEFAISF